MNIIDMGGEVARSVIFAALIVVILSFLYPLLSEDFQTLLVNVAPFIIGSLVVGVGAVGWWLLHDSGGF